MTPAEKRIYRKEHRMNTAYISSVSLSIIPVHVVNMVVALYAVVILILASLLIII